MQEPINVRAVLFRYEHGAWSLDTVDAIDGLFLSDSYVIGQIVDRSPDPQDLVCRDEAAAQRWAIEALRRALTVPCIERVT